MNRAALFWYTGKGFQLLGLMTVGYALFHGLSTQDAKQELTLLGIGTVEFLIGVLCLRGSSTE
jgi:hypothetical protein